MSKDRYKNMDLGDRSLAIKVTVENSIEADYKVGLGVDFYEYLLQDILDDYGIVGNITFQRIEEEDTTLLRIKGYPWFKNYGSDHEYNIAYIVREIELLDKIGIVEPHRGMLVDLQGMKMFNLEDMKLHPKDWWKQP